MQTWHSREARSLRAGTRAAESSWTANGMRIPQMYEGSYTCRPARPRVARQAAARGTTHAGARTPEPPGSSGESGRARGENRSSRKQQSWGGTTRQTTSVHDAKRGLQSGTQTQLGQPRAAPTRRPGQQLASNVRGAPEAAAKGPPPRNRRGEGLPAAPRLAAGSARRSRGVPNPPPNHLGSL